MGMNQKITKVPLGLIVIFMTHLFLATCVNVGASDSVDSQSNHQRDPLVLLRAIARARQHMRSGEMELEVSRYDFGRPLDGTNHMRLKIVFDGHNRRCESFGWEYANV